MPYASAIIESRSNSPRKYLLQLRDYKPESWKGCYALLGGRMKEGEQPHEAIWRELDEEIEFGRVIPHDREELQPISHMTYTWPDDIADVRKRILEKYRVPALTPEGGLDEQQLRASIEPGIDHVFVYRLRDSTFRNLTIDMRTVGPREGRGVHAYPAEVCMALVMAVNDRLALLDYFASYGVEI